MQAAVVLTRWMFPYIACMSLAALAAGVLNTYKRFAVPAATPVLLNLCMMAAAWAGAPAFGRWGFEPIYAMAVGVMAGGVLQVGVQWWALRRLGLQPRPALRLAQWRLAWRDAGVQKILALMGPALLGVGVAHVSMLINTQIASHLAPGSVSWITYSDRLMEFPTALLGVALGVVLMPQLASARAGGDAQRFSDMLDWGLRLVVVLGVPSSVALLVFATPLVASLYHYGAMTAFDVHQVTQALMGWGVGLVGLVALKVLAPGYYAAQDTRTPVRVAVGVLVLTQVFNALLVPYLAHAALTLSIGLGALVNALWLLLGLMRQGRYRPSAGWGTLVLQVVAASALLAIYLLWANQQVSWTDLRAEKFKRLGLLALDLLASAAIYLGALWAAGMKWRALLRR
jgi:putative peptidoglycan lipid II flippase